MDRWYYLKKWFSIFPGFLQPVSAPFLHDYYETRRAERSPLRLLIDGLVYLAFQLWVPFRAQAIARKFGLGGDWARNAALIGRERFVDPNDVAVFRMSRCEDADRYLRRFEYAEISKRINPAAWTSDCVLADKARFAERCAAFGLPSPPLLARVIDGKAAPLRQPQGSELAAKPTRGIGGTGFALLHFPGWDEGAEAFASFLRENMGDRRGDWIVQPKIEGHSAIRDIALNALSTARITTIRNERGKLELVTSVFRCAGKSAAVVDNLALGGLLAGIDPDTGMLGPACYGRRPQNVSRHPETGAAIEGRLIPNWPETRELVLRAHDEAFSAYSMIGWDVGIGARGPVLIEGNGKPGLFAAQRATHEGIGETRFGALIAHHLRNAKAA